VTDVFRAAALVLTLLISTLAGCAVEETAPPPGGDDKSDLVRVGCVAPTASAPNSCGHPAGPSGCGCDAACVAKGDCCADYQPVCVAPTSCAGRCGQVAGGTACGCDAQCDELGDCCADVAQACGEL
jgi:hypothetical protein